MIFVLVGCGGAGEDPEGNNPKKEPTDTNSGGNQKVIVYGIGEAGKTDKISITIDKVEIPSSDILINEPKAGYKFLQVYFTFKNISDEKLETPKNKAIYIVYEEGPTGDKSLMTSDTGSDVLPGPAKETMYRGYVELAPKESTSGWMLYERLEDQTEITMHYYSEYVNTAPDLVFKFKP